jgi:hypothetical protein
VVQLLEQRFQGQGQGLPVLTQVQQLPGLLQLQKVKSLIFFSWAALNQGM